MFRFLKRLLGIRDAEPPEQSAVAHVLFGQQSKSRSEAPPPTDYRSEFARYRLLVDAGGALPVVRTVESGEGCFTPDRPAAWFTDARGHDDLGQIDVTDKGLYFDGEKPRSWPWSKVLAIDVRAGSLIVQIKGRDEPYEFDYSEPHAAELIQLIAVTVWQQNTSKPRRGPNRDLRSVRVSDLPIGDATRIDLGTGRGYNIGIAGESRRQAALRKISAGRRERGEEVRFVVALKPEPENPYDANAVSVETEDGAQLGYLSREDAVDYRAVFQALRESQKVGICRAKLIGGTPDKPSFGVMIDLKSPDSLLSEVTPGGQPF